MRVGGLFKLVFFTLILFFPFYLAPRIIEVKTVECANQYGRCSSDLYAKLEAAVSKPGNLYDKRRQVSQILASDLQVSEFALQLKLPNTLQVKLVERKATFSIGLLDGPKALVDVAGYVIAIVEDTKLPLLQVDELPPDVGEKVSQQSLFALNILVSTYSNFRVKSAKLTRNSLLIELDRGLEVIFPLEGDQKSLMGSLALILAEIDKENGSEALKERVNTIDLRFKNPVVK